MQAVAEHEVAAELGTDLNPQDVHGSDEERQLSFDVGGKLPLESKFALSGALDVPGSFLKGEVVVLRVECVVSEVSFADQHDRDTDQVVGCARKHKARVLDVSVL